MKKYSYNTNDEKEQILNEAKEEGWILVTNAVLFNEKYLLFDTRQVEKIASLQDENADLIFQNAMQDMRIDSVEGENAELIFKVAILEMGGGM